MHRLRNLSTVNGCRCSSRNSASSSLCTINFSTSSRAQRRGFYYELLDVPTSADATQIKDAYYNKCKQLHPDRNLDGDTNAKFQQLKQAYDVLSRPTERNRYDAFCASHPSQNFEFNSQQAAAEEEAAYRRQYRQQYQRDFWEQQPRHRHSQSGPDETRLWLLLSSTSAIILILFVSPWWLLRRKQRRELERMVGKHELANSFLRQPEMAYRDDAVNREILARMFGDNIEDAIRQRREDPEYRLRRMRQDHFRERRARE